MTRRPFAFVVAFMLSASSVGTLSAEDWPRFRGDNGAGVSSSAGLPAEIGPDKNVAWSVELPGGTSSPVIVDGKLYVTTFADADRTLRCLDAATGQEIWQQTVQKVRDENASAPNGPATCTPAADQLHVVVFYPDTALICYSNAGQQRWRVEVGPFQSMHGIANSPIIVGDKVILLVDQVQGSYIAAYSLESGEQVWKADRADGLTGAYSTPGAMPADDGQMLVVAAGTQGLCAYRASDGSVAFTVPGVANSPVTVPLVSSSHVYLCEPVGEVEPMSRYEQLDANQDGKLAIEEVKKYVSMVRMLQGIDQRWGNNDGVVDDAEWNAAFGTMVDKGGLLSIVVPKSGADEEPRIEWNVEKNIPYVASPVHYEGILYVISDGGVLKAVQSSDGKVLKETRLKKGGSSFFASPVAADGKVFLVDTKGRLTVIKADASCEELSTAEFGEEVVATPAICNGRIYVRTKSKLFCFRT